MRTEELDQLRHRFGAFLVYLLWGHVPLMAAAAYGIGQDGIGVSLGAALLATCYHLSYHFNGTKPVTRYISGIALVGEAALLVYLFRGNAWQMDMHMYFFALLALQIAWFDRKATLTAATAIALHHLILLMLVPAFVFPGEGNLSRVLLHASIVALQTAVLVWVGDMIGATFLRLRKASEDMQSLNLTLEQRTIEAEKANSSKSMFLANMSHEIRTPLNAVLGFCHLLQRTELNVRQGDYVSKINTAGTSLLRLINDILDFSKHEAGKLELEATPFNPHATIEQQLQMVLVTARNKGIQLRFEKDKTLPPQLIGDELRFGQVILNLVSNAVKFTEQGSVTVRTHMGEQVDDKTKLIVEISDTGIGMSREQQDRLFNSFTQADNSMTRRFGGTGLGLAISRQIVELMDGEISVESRPWEGTTFRFHVTLGKVLENSSSEIQIPDELRRLRIIAVDDNPASRQIISEVFENWQMSVDVVSSGFEVIDQISLAEKRGTPYDIALIDWKMPNLDGVETITKIRAAASIKQPPKMVLVTAYGSDEFTTEMEGIGISAYLTKPLQPRNLLQTLMDQSNIERSSSSQITQEAQDYSDQVPQVRAELRGQKVLLVEDNHINREIAIELLNDAGLEVDTAENGLEACEQMARSGRNYALILMDLQMPVLDGLEATRRIRQDWPPERMPILAMTAHAYEEERQRCMDAGMDDHISKPVDPRKLVRTLDRWLKPVPQSTAKPVAAAATGPADELPDTLWPFDIAKALPRVNGKRALLKRLILDFANTQANSCNEIRHLLSEGRLQDARRVAHTLKGLAGSLELPALQAEALQLEQAILNQTEGLSELIDRVEAELSPAITAAETLRPAPVAAVQSDFAMKLTIPANELVALHEKLNGQLSKRSLGARSSFKEFGAAIGLDAASVAQHPVQKALEKLDYDTAVTEFAKIDLSRLDLDNK